MVYVEFGFQSTHQPLSPSGVSCREQYTTLADVVGYVSHIDRFRGLRSSAIVDLCNTCCVMYRCVLLRVFNDDQT